MVVVVAANVSHQNHQIYGRAFSIKTINLPPAGLGLKISPELYEDRGLTFTERLEEIGLTSEQIEAVESIVEAESEQRGFHFAAKVLKRIFAHLAGQNTVCAALAHGLGLYDETSVAALAEKLGTSKQALGNYWSDISEMLGPLAPPSAKRAIAPRPTLPGEWLNAVEARKLTGRSMTIIQSAAAAGKIHRELAGTRFYYLESDLLKWDQVCLLAGCKLTRRPKSWSYANNRSV